MNDTGNIPTQNHQTRRCRKCGDENMACEARKVEVWGVEDQFVCPACGHKVVLASAGGVGFYLAAASVVIGVIALIMGLGDGFSTVELLLLVGLFVLFFSPALFDALKRRRYPQTGTRSDTPEHKTVVTATQNDFVRKSMLWLDRLGFIRGFFTLFAILALWFVFWSVVGLIRESLF